MKSVAEGETGSMEQETRREDGKESNGSLLESTATLKMAFAIGIS